MESEMGELIIGLFEFDKQRKRSIKRRVRRETTYVDT